MTLGTYDHYLLAGIALLGTFAAAAGLLWLAVRSPLAGRITAWRGVSPPFVNVVGVLFALTLAFLANDTWIAHDRALSATQQEAGSLRNLVALGRSLPAEARTPLLAAAEAYVRATVDEEWPRLAHRQASPEAAAALDRLLTEAAGAGVAAALPPASHDLLLRAVTEVRAARDLRLSLSQTHVNPLKWMGMAFLGFLTMVSIALVYVNQPRAEIMAVLLFSLAAAPTAAIVLVQGNPFQPPVSVSAVPLAGLLPLR